MKQFLLFIALLTSVALNSFGQDFPFGTNSEDELQLKKYSKDSSAHAVVLSEYGKAYISSNDEIKLIFEYHVKIKIFDSKAFKQQGDIEVPLYKDGNNTFETIRDIEAVTTYVDEAGITRKSELDRNKIFNVNQNKYLDLAKFDMPNLRRGCIIEYKYTTESPFFFNFKTWKFQADIPKIHSEFVADIPAIFQYNIALRGALKLTENKSELNRGCFSRHGTTCDCSKLTFIMNDIPAFVEEDYMTASKNFMSAIYFELSEYTDLSNGVHKKITKAWPDIDSFLKGHEFFGSQIKRKELIKDRVVKYITDQPDELGRAKAIYAYIQKTFKWNDFYGKWSDEGIRKALDKHTGNIGDINLSLIAALKAANISTDAVLLSTRQHGAVNRLYPVESDFDYVIAKVNIGDKSYLLDASDPLLSFGMVPLRCINDQGRVISFEKPSYWMDIAEPEKKATTVSFDLTLQADGKLMGTFSQFSSGYDAYLKRKEIKKFNSPEEYVENLDERYVKVKILKSAIQNLDSLEKPMLEVYEIEINANSGSDHSRLSFNPFIFERTSKNPFKMDDRNYPIDMGIPSSSRFIITLHLPEGFVVESSPKDMAVALPNSGGRLITSFSTNDDACTYSQALQFSKPVYAADEYPYLKEFYNKIIQSENAEIVIKKK